MSINKLTTLPKPMIICSILLLICGKIVEKLIFRLNFPNLPNIFTRESLLITRHPLLIISRVFIKTQDFTTTGCGIIEITGFLMKTPVLGLNPMHRNTPLGRAARWGRAEGLSLVQ